MFPKWHIVFGAVFSLFIWIVWPRIPLYGAIVFFLASFLIDFDHYAYYVYKTGNLSLKKSMRWYGSNLDKLKKMNLKEREGAYDGIYFLHGIEAIVLLALLAYLFTESYSAITETILFVISGFIFHQILDAIDLYENNYRFDKVVSVAYSIKNAKHKRLLQEI